MTPEEIQKLRALETLKVLWELLAVAQKHADVVTWINEGGPEAEDFLDAIESGRPHPLLRLWEERKSTVAANRAAPSRRDRHARRLVVLGCVALERTGLGKLSARKRLARAVRGVFASRSPSVRSHNSGA